MRIGLPAALLALFGAAASAQEIQAPPPGTEFLMKCSGGSESRWVFAENAGGKLRVERVGDKTIYRAGPVWGYMLGDIYDELGLGASGGKNQMTLLRGPPEGAKLQPGQKFRFTYKWASPKGETERGHVITVQGPRRVKTAAFGEQEVFEVTDDITSPLHDLKRTVQYSPALRMFVSFKFRNNASKFEQDCVLASLTTPK
jgi:hypothetical protein